MRFVSNSDGRVLTSGKEIIARLVNQVAGPVRWDLCMETFKELGVTAIIEVSPAGTLVGLAKRALPGVKTLALKTPNDIEAAREIVAEHGDASCERLADDGDPVDLVDPRQSLLRTSAAE
jgi:[acyl-carrier-protein] S-malonyltransferase